MMSGPGIRAFHTRRIHKSRVPVHTRLAGSAVLHKPDPRDALEGVDLRSRAGVLERRPTGIHAGRIAPVAGVVPDVGRFGDCRVRGDKVQGALEVRGQPVPAPVRTVAEEGSPAGIVGRSSPYRHHGIDRAGAADYLPDHHRNRPVL
jgi:hypothetical protein